MSAPKEVAVGGTVYFWFAANTTAGGAGDGAPPLYDVRLAGAASGAAPTASGTPTLLTHANYSDGLHEIALDRTGYAEGEYAVFRTLTISSVNPAGFVGSFVVRAAASTLYEVVQAILVDTAVIGALGAGLTAIPWNASWDTEVQSEVDDALVAQNLDHLVGTAPAIPAIVAGRYIAQSMDDGPAVYDRPTDSLQAIRDTAPLGTAMRGTDSAALASVCTEARLAELDGANLPTDVAAVKTDTAAILIDTAEIGAAGAGLTTLATQASVNTIDDFLDTEVAAILAAVDTEVAAILALLDDARGEPAQGAPPVNPDMATKLDYLYKAWRNHSTQTAT